MIDCKMKSGIYAIMSILDNKMYIGSAADLGRRKVEHYRGLRNGYHFNKKLLRYSNKYGIDNVIFFVLEYVEPNKNSLISREQFYLDTLTPYFNIRVKADSNLGITLSDETREKISAAHTGKKLSPESLEIKRKWQIGSKRSKETRKKMSDSARGNKHWLGKKHSDETKKKIGLGSKGNKNWLGRTHSQETKEKIRLSRLGTKIMDGKWVTQNIN